MYEKYVCVCFLSNRRLIYHIYLFLINTPKLGVGIELKNPGAESRVAANNANGLVQFVCIHYVSTYWLVLVKRYSHTI